MQGSGAYLFCGRARVLEVEPPSKRSSLVKLTFELTDYGDFGVDGAGGAGTGVGAGLQAAPLFVDLVATHKEEMDVLFGAYSRAAVEEGKLLLHAAAAAAAASHGHGGGDAATYVRSGGAAKAAGEV